MSVRTLVALLLLISISHLVCEAQNKPQPGSLTAASNALNPVAPVVKFQVQPIYSIFYCGGQQINLNTNI
ncbi:MAG: hypothetical protein NTW16_01105 [Bacteroidetes bacterium]|nr:hypothetical protein [Bacteroidota bacterium]